jgi:HAD superfamily hydrolase (TIGR01509 family)
MIRAVIFDFDGVLIDSETYKNKAIVQTLEVFGKKVDEKVVAQSTGKSNAERFKELSETYKLRIAYDQYIRAKDEQYAKLLPYIPSIPSNIELLKKCHKMKIEIGLVSGSEDNMLQKNLDRLELRKYFHEIMSEKQVREENLRSKPFPDSYLSMADKLGVRPEECLVIEDSEFGIQAAKGAGMKCLNVGPSESKLADYNVKDASKLDLKELLEGRVVYAEA